MKKCSVPVNIPARSNSSSPSSSPRYDAVGQFFDDDNGMIPPHVILDRRSSGFNDSYDKNARVKNLFLVRNSILKLTGFLES